MSSPQSPNDLHCPAGESSCPIHDEIAEIRRELQILRDQIRIDDLTGLFNHRHMIFSLSQEMERTRRTLLPTTLILADIDYFKRVNDSYGHVVGDKVLRSVGEVHSQMVRKIDIPCRYGGEEFGIILPSTPMAIGIQVAERIRERIEELDIPVDENSKIKISISLGLDCFFAKSQDSVEEFIARTDSFLYQAKNEGRNRVCHANYKMGDASLVSSEEKAALFNPGE